MNLEIDPRYSTYSTSIVLHLLHNNEDYNKLWVSKFPQTEPQASNFFKNENCGCRPVLLSTYKKHRFQVDVFTVDFINSNKKAINLKKFFEENGGQDLAGHVFAIPEGEAHYKDFLAAIQQKKGRFSYFNTLQIDGKILVTFF